MGYFAGAYYLTNMAASYDNFGGFSKGKFARTNTFQTKKIWHKPQIFHDL